MMNRNDYNKIFENEVQHFEVAKLLAQKNLYGFAISHLILGLEELIKYQVIMTKSVNDFSFDDVIDPKKRKSVFKDHLTKHELIKEFQESISENFANKFFNTILLKASGQDVNDVHSEVNKNRFKVWGAFFAIAGSDMNIPELEKADFFSWLKEANNTKNKGLYVNWENNKIETPIEITEEEFNKALKYASSILKQTEFMKSVDLSEEEFIEILNSDLNKNN